MASIGARIRWKNGDILHPSLMWKSPSKRRLPRLLIEDRALEVALLVYIDGMWIIFHETNIPSDKAEDIGSIKLEFYLNRFYLLPEKLKRQDAYEWMRKQDNAVLLWGTENKYFVKPVERKRFI
ncbi:MAG: hypothetical protein Q7K55_08240 [Candidatus Levybacteria bacterium]|nr:hypothetical protein [Candidatus Levybacteria bacterium]